MTEPSDTEAVIDPNLPFVTDDGVSIRVGDIVIYHDAAGDTPAMILSLMVATRTATIQEFTQTLAPGAPLASISLGNSTGQWEPRQAPK
jgi:hypothetical protein